MSSNSFAIYHTWPDLRNAEYEVLQRILAAARNIDKDPIVIDNNGVILWASPVSDANIGSILSSDEVKFCISLHFESPRVCDVYTYYAVWQPVEFYADFGYQNSIDKFSTHNDLLSCHSDIADYHAINIFSGIGRDVITPLPSLFHALPEPFLPPKINSESTLFYIGINWERIGRPKGRFHDVLTKLDARDQIRIYGPELIQGVAPWEGFKTYSGELPFDGSSIQGAINECGICLALSSKAHQNSGIMSNRLFEGLSSGAAVIANPNALIDKYFADVVYTVDDSRGEAFLEQQIVSCLREIRNNPEDAIEKVKKGQEIIRSLCSLEGSIQALFDQTPLRKKNHYSSMPKNSSVTVILVFPDANEINVKEKIDDLSKQMFCKINLKIILSNEIVKIIDTNAYGSIESITTHCFDFNYVPKKFDGIQQAPLAVGGQIAEVLAGIDTEYFCIMRQTDMIMRDHFANLAKALVSQDGASCAVSGALLRTKDVSGREQRRLHEIRLENSNPFLVADGSVQSGRILFRSKLIRADQKALLNLLDGDEHYLFLVAALLDGEMAQSNVASHLHDEAAGVSIRTPAISSDLQRQFIRDYFNGNARWKAKVGLAVRDMTLTPTSDPKSPNRWATIHSHNPFTKHLEPNRTLPVRTGGQGLDYLVAGFSFPEENAVWIVGDRGIIEFTLPRHAASHIEDFQVVMGLCGRRHNMTGRMQHCTFIVNNISVSYQVIPDFFTKIAVKLPLNLMRDTNNFRIEIVPDHAEIVYDISGNVVDNRTLSVLIDSISIVRHDSGSILSVEPNKMHGAQDGGRFVRALTSGFYAPERHGTWICGLVGDIHLRLTDPIENPVLKLRLSGRSDNQTGHAQKAFISVNGRKIGNADLGNGADTLTLPLLPGDLGDIVHISIKALHAEPVLNEAGSIADPRLLGICLFELGIFDGSSVRIESHKPRPVANKLGKRLQNMFKDK